MFRLILSLALLMAFSATARLRRLKAMLTEQPSRRSSTALSEKLCGRTISQASVSQLLIVPA